MPSTTPRRGRAPRPSQPARRHLVAAASTALVASVFLGAGPLAPGSAAAAGGQGTTTASAGSPTAAGPFTGRISVGVGGRQATGDSGTVFPHAVSVSGSGRYVAFTSLAPNLVARDTNGQPDVFLRDRWHGTTRRVSIGDRGQQGVGGSYEVSVSASGRYVAFSSDAPNLVRGDTNGVMDVFVRDTVAGTTRRVSRTATGGQSSAASFGPAISPDGRFVAFETAARLSAADRNTWRDVYLRDVHLGTTRLVSGGMTGRSNDVAWYPLDPVVSAGGRYVAFTTDAGHRHFRTGEVSWNVYRRDMRTGHLDLVSVTSAGRDPHAMSLSPSISDDGRYVAFTSDASLVTDGDSDTAMDVFVRDMVSHRTSLVSRPNLVTGGLQAAGPGTGAGLGTGAGQPRSGSYAPALSTDGRRVAFVSDDPHLVPDDTNTAPDVFVRDLTSGSIRRASVDSRGRQADRGGGAWTTAPAVSTSGRYVVFMSTATNLVAGDTNRRADVFLHRTG